MHVPARKAAHIRSKEAGPTPDTRHVGSSAAAARPALCVHPIIVCMHSKLGWMLAQQLPALATEMMLFSQERMTTKNKMTTIVVRTIRSRTAEGSVMQMQERIVYDHKWSKNA